MEDKDVAQALWRGRCRLGYWFDARKIGRRSEEIVDCRGEAKVLLDLVAVVTVIGSCGSCGGG